MWFHIWFCWTVDQVQNIIVFHSEYFSNIKLSNSADAIVPGDYLWWVLLYCYYLFSIIIYYMFTVCWAVWSIQVKCLSEWKQDAIIYSIKGSVHRMWMDIKRYFLLLQNSCKNNKSDCSLCVIYPLSFYGFCPQHGILPSSQTHRTERFLKVNPGSLNELPVALSDNGPESVLLSGPEYFIFILNQRQIYNKYHLTTELTGVTIEFGCC